MLQSLKYLALFICLFYSCNSAERSRKTLDVLDSNLRLENGVLFYKKTPFNGELVAKYENEKLKSKIEYLGGRKHGYEKQWYDDGTKFMERYYSKGFKTGTHKAWWHNGILKFEYHFNNKGEYHGSVKEWYKTGQLFRKFNYKKGKEVGSQRLWKIDGAIKANYEVVNGERYGLIGLKKCYKVTVNSDDITLQAGM
ncbi:hypothetical protein A8C32_17525 [Flavivirga aquatica]|uniref:Membrane-binding protein n=1 Tax=Flavivirga aquatica TaxID=1849968 RepID=A0A1E5T8G0_9FLAO|nr:hypothetical protein [Flavivirga aquatica]OEK07597.1 hypothetical protein A8C32_17525 [Flavivirga aquatica]